ncbi:MAG: signal transduction histidine kinase [Alphaproteobacteria bacterium]|nr:signal transduction histidine kinase [Alphaproteobacteria bacterium]
MDDLIQDFISETREMLEALGGEVVAWEAAPDDRERLDAIFRFVHTVKGNCGFFDLPRLKGLSHAAEDALAEVRSGSRVADHRLVSAVLGVIDRIGELVQAIESGTALSDEDDDLLIAALLMRGESEEEPAAVPSAAAAARGAMRSIRLPIDLLDRMMNGVSDLVLARNELSRRLRDGAVAAEVDAVFDRLSVTIAEVRDSITRTRMQRIENLFAPLPRMVRDLAAETAKQVLLEMDGGDVELDREMIELIRDPLTHIIRNAMDHGIEKSDLRKRSGKPATGSLRVSARQAGNQILIEIADDGRGIDGDALVRKAISTGLISDEQAARLSSAQKTELIFEAGLSTAKKVTAISGRGVGMDVVRTNIERIGGIVEVDSRLGEGVRFVLKVPLTLTIIPALTVCAGDQTFAIPRSSVEEIVRSRGQGIKIERIGGSSVVTLRGRRLPLVSLAATLGVAVQGAEGIITLLKVAGGGVYALEVDRVQDHEELVIKPAAPALMSTGLYAGTTLADDGKPVLLLDPAGIAIRAGISLERMEVEEPLLAGPSGRAEIQALLLRSLGGARRAVALSAVERIEEVPAEAVQRLAGRLHVLIGDRILPLEGCDGEIQDAKIKVLRLSDGVTQLGYGFAEVIDTVTIDSELVPPATPGEIGGVTLIGGEQIEVIDLHWLFAGHGATAVQAEQRPVCMLPAGDAWMETLLRPIIESAGYRVISSDDADAGTAEIVIVSDEAPVTPSGSAKIVRLRADPEPAGKSDTSIHRYDRAGLLGALGRGTRRKGG